MNKKLRLLVTTKCPNKCPMCCNNSWDFDKLPVVDRWDYDEIMITGGEPLLYANSVIDLTKYIIAGSRFVGYPKPKIYIYTSYVSFLEITATLQLADGMVLTLHKEEDVESFKLINNLFLKHKVYSSNKSLRLNLFPDMKALLPNNIDLSLWKVKDMEWIKDCPVPEGEDFRRIANLW